MTPSDFDLNDPDANGLYLIGDDDIAPIAAAAIGAALCTVRIDLADCRDKASLMTTIADALRFPASFGHNWDALDDCLGDLSWLPASGYVLLFENADPLRNADPESCHTLFDILDDVAADAGDDRLPWYAFVALPDNVFDALEAAGID